MAALVLVNDTGTPADFVTSDATIVGSVTDDVSSAWLTVELDYDDDDLADNSLTTDEFGTFTHDVGLHVPFGPVTVQARGFEFDATVGANIYGTWVSLSFSYIANAPPVAEPGGPYFIDMGQGLTLDATSSSDPDGDPLSYEWDLDGDTAMQSVAFTDQSRTLSWAELNSYGITGPGNYVIELRVSDGTESSAATTNLQVQLPLSALDVTMEAEEVTPIVEVSQELNFAAESVEVEAMFVQLSTIHIHVELPASVSPSGFALDFILSSGARLWANANRTTAIVPTILLIPSQTYDLDLFVEAGAGAATVSVVLQSLLDDDINRQIDRIFNTSEFFVPLVQRLVEDEGVDHLKDWLKDEAEDEFMDPYKQAINNEILLRLTDPAIDPVAQNNLVNLSSNLDGYMDAALDALTNTAFDRLSDRLGFRLPTNSIHIPLFEEAANAPGTLETEMGFEHAFGMKFETPDQFRNWDQIQNALDAVMNSDPSPFQSLVKNPATYIESFSYKMDYTTVNGNTFKFQGGVSDFLDHQDWKRNEYYLQLTIPDSPVIPPLFQGGTFRLSGRPEPEPGESPLRLQFSTPPLLP